MRTAGRRLIGRWPANLVHDGSEEVLVGFPNSVSKGGVIRRGGRSVLQKYGGFPNSAGTIGRVPNDRGSAARFFYCAKADRSDRGPGNTHPTVKPAALIEWLCKLTSPPGDGITLDPFMGSGSTGLACARWAGGLSGLKKTRRTSRSPCGGSRPRSPPAAPLDAKSA